MTLPVPVRNVFEAATLIDSASREDMSLRECSRLSFEGLMRIRELLPELGEASLTGVAFVALASDGSATFVVAGESYRAARILWRSVQ